MSPHAKSAHSKIRLERRANARLTAPRDDIPSSLSPVPLLTT